MKRILLHPKGYRAEIHSWENDSDNHNKVIFNIGENEALVAYILELVSGPLRLIENHPNIHWDDEESAAYKSFKRENKLLLEKHRKALESSFEPSKNFPIFEGYMEYLEDDLIDDFGLSSENYFCRVVQKLTITFSSEDVYVDLFQEVRWKP